MTDLYVSTNGSDSSAGTQASPFKTISHAADVAAAGSTVHVAPGTYQGGFRTNADGVTYVSDVKWGAKIVPGSGNDSLQAWDNRGANVTIDGFEIDGSAYKGGTPWLFGVYTAGSDSVVKNVKVHDLVGTDQAYSTATNGGQGGAGIMGDGYFGGTNITVTGNDIYRIGPDGGSSNLVHGIYMSTSGTVSNNAVHWVVGDGITSWHDASNLNIANNTVGWVGGAGVMIGAGDYYHSDAPHDNSRVTGNTITHSGKGVEEFGNVGSHNVYSDNTLSANGTNWELKSGARAAAAAPAEPSPEHVALIQQMAEAAHPEAAAAAAAAEVVVAHDAAVGFDLHPVLDDGSHAA